MSDVMSDDVSCPGLFGPIYRRSVSKPTVSRMPKTLTLRSMEQLLEIQQNMRLFLPVA